MRSLTNIVEIMKVLIDKYKKIIVCVLIWFIGLMAMMTFRAPMYFQTVVCSLIGTLAFGFIIQIVDFE